MKKNLQIAGSILCITMMIMLGADTAYSASEETFSEIEYHFILKNMVEVGDTLETLPQEVVEQLHIFEFDPEPKHYKVMYVDSRDRVLRKENMILRVRANVKKPKKSKVTIKSRSKDAATLVDLPDGEYEIDVSGVKNTYSASLDMKYSKEELDDNSLTTASLLDFIQQRNPDALQFLKPIQDNPEAAIPGVVDRFQFEGHLKDRPSVEEIEFDFEMWIFDTGLYLTELAFSGEMKDKAALDALYSEVQEFLTQQDILSPEQFSKTQFYFDFFNK
ncbi:MAG: hypothetical protein GY801_03965 [bacterium]|nr:hypothetical protein [bacterium]